MYLLLLLLCIVMLLFIVIVLLLHICCWCCYVVVVDVLVYDFVVVVVVTVLFVYCAVGSLFVLYTRLLLFTFTTLILLLRLRLRYVYVGCVRSTRCAVCTRSFGSTFTVPDFGCSVVIATVGSRLLHGWLPRIVPLDLLLPFTVVVVILPLVRSLVVDLVVRCSFIYYVTDLLRTLPFTFTIYVLLVTPTGFTFPRFVVTFTLFPFLVLLCWLFTLPLIYVFATFVRSALFPVVGFTPTLLRLPHVCYSLILRVTFSWSLYLLYLIWYSIIVWLFIQYDILFDDIVLW
jgi:hypothetical protein